MYVDKTVHIAQFFAKKGKDRRSAWWIDFQMSIQRPRAVFWKEKRSSPENGHVSVFGLSDKTWTCGLYHPKVARYQLRHTQIPLNFKFVRCSDFLKGFRAPRRAEHGSPPKALYIIAPVLAKVNRFLKLFSSKVLDFSFFDICYNRPRLKALVLRRLLRRCNSKLF